jgi:hypothetical protein
MTAEFNFIDGVQRNKENPDTFRIPSDEDKRNVKVGDNLKVGCTAAGLTERFWVKVTGIGEDCYLCQVDNELVYTTMHGLSHGDPVAVQHKHILSIWS